MSVDNRTAANLTALLVDVGPEGTDPVVVTRGWVDPQNRGSRSHSSAVMPGKAYRLRWACSRRSTRSPPVTASASWWLRMM